MKKIIVVCAVAFIFLIGWRSVEIDDHANKYLVQIFNKKIDYVRYYLNEDDADNKSPFIELWKDGKIIIFKPQFIFIKYHDSYISLDEIIEKVE